VLQIFTCIVKARLCRSIVEAKMATFKGKCLTPKQALFSQCFARTAPSASAFQPTIRRDAYFCYMAKFFHIRRFYLFFTKQTYVLAAQVKKSSQD